MMRRLPARNLLMLVVTLACAACGGSSTVASCADLAPAYSDPVTQLVASEGTRDPVAYSPEFADLARWWPNVRVIAWLSDALTADEIHSLEAEVGTWERVTDVAYFTKSDALQVFRELFAEEPELLAAVPGTTSLAPPVSTTWTLAESLASGSSPRPGRDCRSNQSAHGGSPTGRSWVDFPAPPTSDPLPSTLPFEGPRRRWRSLPLGVERCGGGRRGSAVGTRGTGCYDSSSCTTRRYHQLLPPAQALG